MVALTQVHCQLCRYLESRILHAVHYSITDMECTADTMIILILHLSCRDMSKSKHFDGKQL